MRRLLIALATLACVAPIALAQPKAAPKAAAPKAAAAKAPAVAPRAAPQWRANAATSLIRVTGHFDAAAIVCNFPRWTSDIRFDPANLPGSSVRVVVDPTAVACVDPDHWGLSATLQESGWFDTRRAAAPAANKQVIFQSTSFRAVGAGRYEAAGTLTAKGRAVPVTLPFTLTIAGANADMAGALTIDRTKFAMTDQGDEIAHAAAISVHVVATRAP